LKEYVCFDEKLLAKTRRKSSDISMIIS